MTQIEDRAVIFGPGEGEKITFKGSMITLKVTSTTSDERIGVYEIRLEPHAIGANLHYHRFIDEVFLVIKGQVTLSLPGREVVAGEGTVIYIPRFTPHGFSNCSDKEVIINLIFIPGQKREGFFRELGKLLSEQTIDSDRLIKLYQEHDSYPFQAKQ